MSGPEEDLAGRVLGACSLEQLPCSLSSQAVHNESWAALGEKSLQSELCRTTQSQSTRDLKHCPSCSATGAAPLCMASTGASRDINNRDKDSLFCPLKNALPVGNREGTENHHLAVCTVACEE